MRPPDEDAVSSLLTVRDWLRHATSRFRAEGLQFGHGTTRAVDEAAFLILHTLSLPIDELDPWLDARLTITERRAIKDIIERRISTRKPAPYITNQAWIGGVPFYVDERVIVPRPLIGELLVSGALDAALGRQAPVASILDLCTGSGCLAILAAMVWPNASVDAVDIDEGALEVARRNVTNHDLESRVRLVKSDLFAGVDGRRYDLVIANPPYVNAAAIAAFPPEHRAEPILAHAGGEDGLDIVHRIMAEAPVHLAPEGQLVLEVGTARELMETAYPRLAFVWLDTEETTGEVLLIAREGMLTLPPKARSGRGSRKGG
ncbi:MAG TPA: 50S ribosomal protein L3 N(5)-glutamine methyltransferase [Hyphomicrobiaceae bacterium]|nr:50S ribosomal protein L3 N(5)-glutamine methyltransferase [Hyphomicrobiaceae bacterium]